MIRSIVKGSSLLNSFQGELDYGYERLIKNARDFHTKLKIQDYENEEYQNIVEPFLNDPVTPKLYMETLFKAYNHIKNEKNQNFYKGIFDKYEEKLVKPVFTAMNSIYIRNDVDVKELFAYNIENEKLSNLNSKPMHDMALDYFKIMEGRYMFSNIDIEHRDTCMNILKNTVPDNVTDMKSKLDTMDLPVLEGDDDPEIQKLPSVFEWPVLSGSFTSGAVICAQAIDMLTDPRTENSEFGKFIGQMREAILFPSDKTEESVLTHKAFQYLLYNMEREQKRALIPVDGDELVIGWKRKFKAIAMNADLAILGLVYALTATLINTVYGNFLVLVRSLGLVIAPGSGGDTEGCLLRMQQTEKRMQTLLYKYPKRPPRKLKMNKYHYKGVFYSYKGISTNVNGRYMLSDRVLEMEYDDNYECIFIQRDDRSAYMLPDGFIPCRIGYDSVDGFLLHNELRPITIHYNLDMVSEPHRRDLTHQEASNLLVNRGFW